jgi:hypothetical protein
MPSAIAGLGKNLVRTFNEKTITGAVLERCAGASSARIKQIKAAIRASNPVFLST